MTTTHRDTQNHRGVMHPFSSTTKQFIAYASECNDADAMIMDMGCAYGNVVNAALNAGANHIIACDMAQEHLDVVKSDLATENLSKLSTHQGVFPQDYSFNHSSVQAIHASHILEFLNGSELMAGLAKFHNWLCPGGKLFIVCYSIFIKELDNSTFKTEYQSRKISNVAWPGYLENYNNYITIEDSEIDDLFPSAFHLYEKEILESALAQAGFSIESSVYLNGRDNGAVEYTWHDGREYIGIVATRI